jgi:hypothetical protein
MVPEAEDLPSLRLKHASSVGVFGLCVLRAVQFNDELFLDTTEVCNVWRDRMLAAALKSIQLATAQEFP